MAPRMFKSRLARFAPQFSGFNQHDSQVRFSSCSEKSCFNCHLFSLRGFFFFLGGWGERGIGVWL